MGNLVLRSEKGAALTHEEMDNNLSMLNGSGNSKTFEFPYIDDVVKHGSIKIFEVTRDDLLANVLPDVEIYVRVKVDNSGVNYFTDGVKFKIENGQIVLGDDVEFGKLFDYDFGMAFDSSAQAFAPAFLTFDNSLSYPANYTFYVTVVSPFVKLPFSGELLGAQRG